MLAHIEIPKLSVVRNHRLEIHPHIIGDKHADYTANDLQDYAYHREDRDRDQSRSNLPKSALQQDLNQHERSHTHKRRYSQPKDDVRAQAITSVFLAETIQREQHRKENNHARGEIDEKCNDKSCDFRRHIEFELGKS